MISFSSDAKLALRSLRRRPRIYGLVIATLAVGIGVNVSVFSFAQALLLRPLPFAEADRLVRIEARKGTEPGRISQREIEDLQQNSEVFERLASYYLSQYNVTGDGPPEAAPCAINSHELFETLGASFVHGGPFSASEDFRRQYRVVLQHDFWQRRYGGDPDIVGQSIVLDGGSYVVDGVLAPATMDFPPGVRLYRQVTEYHGLDGRRHSVVGKLRQGISLDVARQELRRFQAQWEQAHPEINRGVRFDVVPLRDTWVDAARPYLVALAAAVGLVLLMAVANVVNLLLMRSADREHEMAVRSSLGAPRRRLIRQLLAEGLVLSALGGVLGLAVAAGAIRALTHLVRADLPSWMEIRIDPSALGATAGLVLLTGLFAGFAPAFRVTRSGLATSVRSGGRATGERSAHRMRSVLVTCQVALALVLLLGAGLMTRSALALHNERLGFEAGNLLTFRVDPPYWNYHQIEQLTPFYDEASRALGAIPGIEGVAANQNLPLAALDENNQRIVTLEGQTSSEQEQNSFVHLQSVGPAYFDVLSIGLSEGRGFTPADRQESQQVAVIGRHLAETLWPTGQALGSRLKLGPPEAESPWLTVVGVVEDVRSARRVGPPSPDLYVSNRQHFTGDTYFALRTSLQGPAVLRQIEAAIHSADADIPIFDVAPLSDRVARSEWQRRVTSVLFVVFGLLALALAALGIFGVISLAVTQRRREFGLRLALGARPRTLFSAVIRGGFRMFLWGTLLGLIGFVGLARILASQLYGVQATDPAAWIAAWSALSIVALAASLAPAIRAARVSPTESIREVEG